MDEILSGSNKKNEFDISQNDNELMKEACKTNSLSMIKALYKNGANLTEEEFNILIRINSDIRYYNEDVIRFAVTIVDKFTIELATELIKRIPLLKANIVKDFLVRELDIRDKDELLLRTACEYNNASITNYLIEYGLDVHPGIDICLEIAAKKGNIRIAEILLESGSISILGLYKAMEVAYYNKNFTLVRYFYSQGARLYNVDHYAYDDLLAAVVKEIAFPSDVLLIKCLIEEGAKLKKSQYKQAFQSIRESLVYDRRNRKIFLRIFEHSVKYKLMIIALI